MLNSVCSVSTASRGKNSTMPRPLTRLRCVGATSLRSWHTLCTGLLACCCRLGNHDLCFCSCLYEGYQLVTAAPDCCRLPYAVEQKGHYHVKHVT